VEILSFGAGEVALFTAPAPEKSPEGNEDAAGIFVTARGRGLLAVADGLGGQPGGAHAASRLLAMLWDSVLAAGREDPSLRGAILDGVERANREILALGTGGASTLVAAEIEGDRLRSYHVGDSDMLVVGQRGRIKLKTIPHSPVGYAVEAGMLDPAEAMHHEDRHLVSNAVGTPDMRIEVGSQLQLAPRDTLLLGSDGLFDNLHLHEIADIVRRGPLRKAATALAEQAQRRMREPASDHPSKPDDLTFLLFRLGAPSRSAARG
jgi:serine/threonine protein phosphatase PrpC